MVKMKYGIVPKKKKMVLYQKKNKGFRAGNLYTFIIIPHYPDDGYGDEKYIGNSEMNKMESLNPGTQGLLGNILIPLSESTIIIKLIDSLDK